MLPTPLCRDFQPAAGVWTQASWLRCLANDSPSDYPLPVLEECPSRSLVHFRRASRLGAKAGNLNHALTQLQLQHSGSLEATLPPVFLLLDADGKLAEANLAAEDLPALYHHLDQNFYHPLVDLP